MAKRRSNGRTRASRQGKSGGVQDHGSFTWNSYLLLDHKFGKRMALEMIGRIMLRTSRGRDWKNKPFRPYTPDYAKLRAKKGLTPDLVDLRVTGDMLGSISLVRIDEQPQGMRLLIAPGTNRSRQGGPPQNMKAAYLEAKGRVFMALSRADMDRIYLRAKRQGLLKKRRGSPPG